MGYDARIYREDKSKTSMYRGNKGITRMYRDLGGQKAISVRIERTKGITSTNREDKRQNQYVKGGLKALSVRIERTMMYTD